MNQITPAECAYAAGFFDGEGWLGRKKRSSSDTTYQLRVHVTQNDRAPLDWLRERFGGSVLWERHAPRNPRHRWVTSGAPAKEFLAAVLPYLIVKRERALLALTVPAAEIPNTRSA